MYVISRASGLLRVPLNMPENYKAIFSCLCLPGLQDGKYLKKKNTFTDVVASAEHLIAENYTSKDRLCIQASLVFICLHYRNIQLTRLLCASWAADVMPRHNVAANAMQGRSAGGLTMGASLNLRPDLYKAAILGVPFVDVLTTMLDDTIPLTTTEVALPAFQIARPQRILEELHFVDANSTVL